MSATAPRSVQEIAVAAAEEIMALNYPKTPAINNLSAIVLRAIAAAVKATGEREAELREKPEELCAFAESLSETILIRLARTDARASLSFIGQHLAIAGDILAALTPLLDRREGELDISRAERQVALQNAADLKRQLRAQEDELAAKDTLIADLRDQVEVRGQMRDEAVEAMNKAVRESADKDAELARERAELTEAMNDAAEQARSNIALRKELASAQSALRESEAARGEDSKRLDWLEAQQGESLSTLHLSQCGSGGMGRSWFKKQIRAAIDDARAQEAKP